jgi:oligosaccharide repeat unit polymerase
MSIVVCSVFVVVLLWALASNPDSFSPAKFFLFSFLIFHLGVFSSRHPYELWMLILLVLLVGATAVLFEALNPLPREPRYALVLQRRPDPRHFLVWIWALSLPAVAAEGYLLWKLGGLQAYVNLLGSRVVEFRGSGWAIALSSTIVTFNLAYFAVGLTRTRSRLWWSAYCVHFLMTLAIGLLSGSRGGFLNIFALQIFCYHYIKGNVRLTRALPVAVALLAAALLLGAIRNSVRFENDTFSTGWAGNDQALEYSAFQGGIQPLQILLDADQLKPAYGLTLVSVVTNVVPRDWWPDKPDTGGVFFTKEYTGNAWGGYSNLTPTLLGEAIINFGWVMGIVTYVLAYPALMYAVVRYYRRVVVWARAERGATAAIELLLYVCVMWGVVGLMVAEVTTTVVSFLAIKVLPLLLLKFVFDQPLRPVRRLTANAAAPRYPTAGPLLNG